LNVKGDAPIDGTVHDFDGSFLVLGAAEMVAARPSAEI